MTGLLVDSFAGGGGASLGIEMALGRSPDIAINHDAEALAMHAANHPGTEHYCKSVWKVDPLEAARGRPVDLLWASPDCFPAGTMVLTDRGYRAIESIVEGDRVLTHAGRYRRVYATMRSVRAVRAVDIQGVPTITVSDEHPFLARAARNVWDNEHRRYARTLLAPTWVRARNLRAGAAPMNAAGGDLHFCATPCRFEPLPIPQVGGRGIEVDERLMWLAGRYVGDGWTRIGDGRAELVIICGKAEADELAGKLSLWPRAGARAGPDELAWHRRETATACQFSTNYRGLVEWLRAEFGHGGAEKSFPAWSLASSEALRRALLDGYVSADGCKVETSANQVIETITISRALALSTKALVESLGYTATASRPRKSSSTIEGRAVNAKPTYMVRWRETPLRAQTVRDELYNWSRVQSVGPPGELAEVFNISVEEDETYVADGIVVHNCKHFSKAKGARPAKREIRDLAWVVVLWAKRARPRIICLENVEEFCFPPETTVLCKRGMVPISSLQIGDEVWTHNARWKPVTAISRRVASTIRVSGHGNSIVETTGNHEFYVRRTAPRITVSGKGGRHKKRLLEPEWVRADRLSEIDESSAYTRPYSGFNWATPRELPRYWQRMPAALGVDVNAPAFFYMLGRWLGDGWIRKRRERSDQDIVRICANLAESDALEERLAATGLKWSRARHTSSVDIFDLSAPSSRILIPWLRRHFGEFAQSKTLPAWIFGASEEQRWALIAGYLDADGHEQDGGLVASSSVSRCLAVGLKLLLQSLGLTASVSRAPAREMPGIESDVPMRCREVFTVSWRRNNEWEKCARSELHFWGRVRAVEPCRTDVEVVDITVADDHSFIADGQVVHNCTWGPLTADGKPCPERRGQTFDQWVSELRRLGYRVQWRQLRACDYGAPTSRKRLFLVARCDGLPIVWPTPTHGRPGGLEVATGALRPWRTAAECIDWTLPCHSIFLTRDEGRAVGVNRPLAEATMARIARGVQRFVIGCADPFIVPITHRGDARVHDINEPLRTVTTAHRGELALAAPFLQAYYGDGQGGRDRSADPAEPLRTQTTENRHAVVAPFLVPRYGERPGQEPRCHDILEPAPTVVPTANTTLVSEFLAQHNGGMVGHDAREPVSTLTAKGCHQQVVSAFMLNHKGSARQALAAEQPVPTICASATHAAEVRAFLIKYYGEGGQDQDCREPLHTIPTKGRFGLVRVAGEPFEIVDIGMRMLSPRELFRAQGFPDSYVIDPIFDGRPMTRTSQVRMCGNSVCPQVAAAIVAANMGSGASRHPQPRPAPDLEEMGRLAV